MSQNPDRDAARQAYLDLLTDPANDPSGRFTDSADMLEELEELESYADGDAFGDARDVADRLLEHHARTLRAAAADGDGAWSGKGEPRFSYVCDTDGVITMFGVAVHLGDANYYTRLHDIRHLSTDRLATGVDAALGYAEAIDGKYQRLLVEVRGRGLLD